MALPGLSFEVVRTPEPRVGLRSDRTALLALTERGPEEAPTEVHSYDHFVRVFGCRMLGALGPLAAKGYYDNGGQLLTVARFVPAEAKAAAGTLPVVHASTPNSYVIAVSARHRGAFGDRLRVRAECHLRRRARGSVTGPLEVTLVVPHFDSADLKLPVRVLGSTGDAWTRLDSIAPAGSGQKLTLSSASGLSGDVIVELYQPHFSLHILEAGRAEGVVRGIDLRDLPDAEERLAGSGIQISSTVATTDAELPVHGAVVQLSGGDDGLDPSGSIQGLRESFERCIAALERSDTADVVVAPDLWSKIFETKRVRRLAFDPATSGALADALVRSAARTRDRVVVLDPPLTDDARPLSGSELEAWRAEREAELSDARDFAAVFSPWLRIVAGPVVRGDDTLLIPPSAHVAGRMAKTARERGAWIATGNVSVEQAVGLERAPHLDEEEALYDLGINPLRMSLPRGATVYGVRSLSWPDRKAWRFLSTRRLFNFLHRALTPLGQSYAFEPNSPSTWIKLRRDIDALLRALFDRGAFTGSRPEEAYFVRVDEGLNPEELRDQGVLTAQIGVAPAVPLEFLLVRLHVQNGVARVSEEPLSS